MLFQKMIRNIELLKLLCLLIVIFFTNGEVHTTVHVTVSGCDTARRLALLHQILKKTNSNITGDDVFLLNSNNTAPIQLKITHLRDDTDPAQPTYSDASFCFFDRGVLMNQNRAISRLYQSFARVDSSLQSNSSSTPKPVFLIYEGSQTDHAQLNALAATALRCDSVLRQPQLAQWLTASEALKTKSSVPPRLLLLPFSSKIERVEELIDTFQTAWTHQLNILLKEKGKEKALIQNSTSPVTSPSPIAQLKHKIFDKRQWSLPVTGMEKVNSAISKCESMLRSLLSRETQKLMHLSAGQSFANFIDKNIVLCENHLLDEELPTATVSENVRQLALHTIRRNIATNLKPLFLEKLEAAMQDTLQNFNNEVQEVQLSLDFIKELCQLQNKHMRQFHTLAEDSIPSTLRNKARDDPSLSWSEARHQAESRLSRVFGDYLKNREELLCAQQVLPLTRNRPQIDLSLHYLLLHPLGRDYRQSPLLFSQSDKVIFNPQLIPVIDSIQPLCDVLTARETLRTRQKEQLNKQINMHNKLFNLFFSRITNLSNKANQDAEFAREMLMFALSLKSPSVPLAGGRNKDLVDRHSVLRPSSNDILLMQRDTLSPQTLLSCDTLSFFTTRDTEKDRILQSTLKEVRNGLQQSKQLDVTYDSVFSPNVPVGEKVVTKMFNLFSSYYKHPPINYGTKYSSQTFPS